MAGIKEAREALLDERQRTAQRLSEIDAALSALDSLLGQERAPSSNGRVSATRGRAAGPGTRAGKTIGRAPREGTMAAVIESFLSDQGRKATHAEEVLRHLQNIEKAPGGKNPKASVEQTLRQLEQRGRVKNIGRNRWRTVAG
jgi:hypothetical protein